MGVEKDRAAQRAGVCSREQTPCLKVEGEEGHARLSSDLYTLRHVHGLILAETPLIRSTHFSPLLRHPNVQHKGVGGRAEWPLLITTNFSACPLTPSVPVPPVRSLRSAVTSPEPPENKDKAPCEERHPMKTHLGLLYQENLAKHLCVSRPHLKGIQCALLHLGLKSKAELYNGVLPCRFCSKCPVPYIIKIFL